LQPIRIILCYGVFVSSNTRSPGRPRLFDEETVLDRATELFWEQGYAQTSVADLVEATGVHKPSLYRTFGSKDDLFALVLRRYADTRIGFLTEQVAACGPGVEGIHEFLSAIQSNLADNGARRGCLLIASSSERRGTTPGFEDFGAAYRQAFRAGLQPLAARAGGSPSVTDQRAQVLATLLLGLDVTARGGASAPELDETFAAIRHVVDTWRSDEPT